MKNIVLFVSAGLLAAPTMGAPTWQRVDVEPELYEAKATYDRGRGCIVLVGLRTWEYWGDTWTPGGTHPPALGRRAGHAIAHDARRGRTVLFGGNPGGGVRNDTWEYDGATWVPGPAAPASLAPRGLHAMAFDERRGTTVMHGGRIRSQFTTGETWEFDGGTWTPGVPGPIVESHCMAYDSLRQVVATFGGFTDDGSIVGGLGLYDGSGWTGGPSPAVALRDASLAFDRRRNVLVLFGGYGLGSIPGVEVQADTWELDAAGTWRPGPVAPPELGPRQSHAMSFDEGSGLVILFGGYDGAASHCDTWAMDGATWSAEPGSPCPEVESAMAWDASRERVVLYDRESRTWEWDGARWNLSPAVGAPGTRVHHAMSYDDARDRVMLFGGDAAGTTWEFDGSAWSPGAAAPAAMSARELMRMVFDRSRARTVLFGGRTRNSVPLNETWEHDGGSWQPGAAAPPGMRGRTQHGLAYHEAMRRVVLFGGVYGATQLGDVWEYDGAAWSAGAPPPSQLTPRAEVRMAYLGSEQQVVLYGGDAAAIPQDDVWGYNASGWTFLGAAPPELGARRGLHMVETEAWRRLVLFKGVGSETDTWELGDLHEAVVAGTGFGANNGARFRLLTRSGTASATDVQPYAATFGTNVATGRLDPAAPFVLTGPGPGPVLGPHVRAFRADGTTVSGVSFYAYGTLRYGVNVGAGDLDGSSRASIVTGAGGGASFGPHVRGWSYTGSGVVAMAGVSYFAYQTLRYGVNVAAGEVDRDGFDEIVTAPGPGPAFLPVVRGWNVDGGSVRAIGRIHFAAFATLGFGAHVAAGDVDDDGAAEIVASPGPGSGHVPRFAGFDVDATPTAPLPGFDVTLPIHRYGGRVALGDLRAGEAAELLAGHGPDPAATSALRTFLYRDGLLEAVPLSLLPFPDLGYGVNAAVDELL